MPEETNHIDLDIAWCPGCGNFAILKALKQAIQDLSLDNPQLVLVSGIGQAAKTPQYMNANFFNGLHGRALPIATAVKAANPNLTVIVNSGEGDMYGEGGNHFIHTIRRNPNITVFVHNNMVYGLTKGQASPTSQVGFKTPVQVGGVTNEPFNPVAVAIAMNSSFVGRAFCGHFQQTVDLMKDAITHRGFSLVDIFQPCVTFNKVNNYKWFNDHTYYVGENYDPTDKVKAFVEANNPDKFALGKLYRAPDKMAFEDALPLYGTDKKPLYQRSHSLSHLKEVILSTYQ